MSEYKLHLAIKAHIESAFIGPQNPNLKFWHVPNETRDATDAYFKKQMGVLPGVLDLCFGWPHKQTGVLEIKMPGEKITAAQNRFMSWANLIGWHTGAAYTVRQAHNVLCRWELKASHNNILEPDYATQEEKFRRGEDFFRPRE